MFDLNAIQLFVKVVEADGFSGASRALGLPKSTLSRKVRELEVSLGTVLMHRNSRGLALTETGRSFYERCRQVVDHAAAAMQETQSGSAALQGLLRLTAPIGLGQSTIQQMLMRFLAHHPGLQAELVLSDERVNIVRDGFDLALRMGELENSELRMRRLATFDRILCASPGYLRHAGEPRHPDDLRRHACIVIRREPATWELKGPKGIVRAGLSWRLCTNNIAAIRVAALDDGGIALLPHHLIQHDLAAGELVHILKDWVPPPSTLSALTPPGRATPAAAAFIDHLISELTSSANGQTGGAQRRRAKS